MAFSGGVSWWWRWYENCDFSINMGRWRLSRQGISQKPLGGHWKKCLGEGVVQSNFIVNYIFSFGGQGGCGGGGGIIIAIYQ